MFGWIKKKDKRADELILTNKEKDKRADELVLANKEKDKRADELVLANKEKDKRADELILANKEKDKRADELVLANKEKDKRADELVLANKEKDKRADELILANKELAFQNQEKDSRADELVLANQEKDKRADEVVLANRELAFQNQEKDKRAEELAIANQEKDKRADELAIANQEKDKRADELAIANQEKDKRADELMLANQELAFQNKEKDKRANELMLANQEKDKLADELAITASVFSHAREGISITDATGTIIDVNATFTTITGYSREEAIGQNLRMLESARQAPAFYVDMWQTVLNDGFWSGDIWSCRKNGEVYPEMLNISSVKDITGQISNFVTLFTDITPMKEYQSQLEHIAHYDVLTHLPNRTLLADRLSQAMLQCDRHQQSLAVAFIDLDGFKAVNDTYGHDIGDQLLTTLSLRMKEVLRECDTLARIGGDEFVAVLADLARAEDCKPVLERLLLAVSDPVLIDKLVLNISASIGVSFYPKDGVDDEQLMRYADQAMYVAKELGKNCYHLLDMAQDETVKVQRESLEAIQSALNNNQIVLYYQPKVNMKTGEVIGVEALMRWQHPTKGLLNPADFLPTMENYALSIEFGEWVIDTALRQISQWQKTGLNLPISTSVNIAAAQLRQPDFTQRLTALLAAHPDVEPSYLELEILEKNALDDIHHVSTIMQACMALGVKFALDDFGTGYSSLTYLRRLPAKVINIDPSFVRNMLDDADDFAIVEGIIALAKPFKRGVIAKGVETIEQGMALLQLGCEIAQGSSIAKPMLTSDVQAWVANWKPDASWDPDAIWKI
ncbi:EAL domain-containing protein [Colwellia sp. MB02u-10]|uniref:putative bifunctional diguanylate cyclase/phosphodiesterase n=1 Tax=Colwellia sp. MB02u-10 TaxID=2759828 RepID=UPI0015F543C2|nr:EAL domain-containing protein [Colwellia sp. MB02u-10]MBA6339562.1 EAL domain-containing protein [Colwellia sp. MB02u-10]